MKKAKVQWTEFHNYEVEIEIPDNLSKEEEVDWVMNNSDDWGMWSSIPYDIVPHWDSFHVEDAE